MPVQLKPWELEANITSHVLTKTNIPAALGGSKSGHHSAITLQRGIYAKMLETQFGLKTVFSPSMT